MKISRVDAIANTVLYEGFMLYPYRPSAVKNQQRFNFGVVAPEAKPQAAVSSELCSVTTECLLRGSLETTIAVEVRFLQLVQRNVEIPEADGFVLVLKTEMDGKILSSWQEAIERRVSVEAATMSDLLQRARKKEFAFSATRETEPIYNCDGELAARYVRVREQLHGYLDVMAVRVGEDLFRVTARVGNTSNFSEAAAASHEAAMMSSFLSTHTVLRTRDGEFISLTDPGEQFRDAASACKNIGTWPVLAAESADRADVLLSSPIILYDYPEIAPESAGDLFDGTEIDEILQLRILTMTDEEKREMRSVDERTRAILERTELLPAEHFLKLHGGVRESASAEKERA